MLEGAVNYLSNKLIINSLINSMVVFCTAKVLCCKATAGAILLCLYFVADTKIDH